MNVDPTTERQDGIDPDALARAVHQGVAEVRRRNALVVAGVRIALGMLGLVFALSGGGNQGEPGLALAVPAGAGYVALSCLMTWLLHQRWRSTAVAFSAVVVDVVLVAGASLVVAGPGTPAIAHPVGYLVGILLLILLFGAVALRLLLFAPLVAAVIVLQLVLGIRAGIPIAYLAVGTLSVCAFAAVMFWAGMRMVKLAAGMAVTEAAASLAERHARALEAAHAEVAAQRDRLVSAQNEAEALAQVIVHDLKNPLATLLQYVSLAETELKTVPGAAGLVDYLAHASDEGRRLSKLIGDLLLVYRLERGAMAPAREPVPMKLLLQSVARRFAHRALERGVTVELHADEDLVVPADLDLSQRMLENLLSNALRHVNRGDRVSMEARATDGEIRIAVRNSGPPVQEDLRTRLFDRFVTGGRREFQNAGLGLYLCRLVAEAHSGSIALVDAPGWNVSFEVALPLLPCAGVDPREEATARLNEAP